MCFRFKICFLKKKKKDWLVYLTYNTTDINLKFLEKLQKDRLENEQHELINIGNCGLHTIHDVFKTGTESTSWNIRKTLHDSYQILLDSTACRDDFEIIATSDIYPFDFCATW